MNETADLVRHLFDHLTVAGTLTEDDWLRFKSDHRVDASCFSRLVVRFLA